MNIQFRYSDFLLVSRFPLYNFPNWIITIIHMIMDIKCAALIYLVLVVLTIIVGLTETRLPPHGSFLGSPLGGIITRKNAEVQKREKKSLKDADINLDEVLASGLADKLHSRHKRRPPVGIAVGIITIKNVKLQSEVRKREKRCVEDTDMNLDEYLALGMADKPLNRHKRFPPQGRIFMTTNNVKLHSEVRKREKRSLKNADKYFF